MTEEQYSLDEDLNPRLIAPEETEEEIKIERTLRPKTLVDFVGQKKIKEPLNISIEAAKARDEAIEHVLLYGNPGLGKTTLAHIIAHEMGSEIKTTAGPALERVGDLAAILSNLGKGDVLFIDEIHRMNKTIEEVLYSAMEDYALDIIIGKGPAARTLRMPLERFTLIGATTKMNLLSGPLRDRFGHIFHLEYYENTDIEHILSRNAATLEIDMDIDSCRRIASRARQTPRVANRLLRRVRDYAQVRGDGIINQSITENALSLLRIDHLGLDDVDRQVIRTIMETFDGGPVGLGTLSAAIAEDTDTLETIYEPYLLQIGMIERTPRGRKTTKQAHDHIKNSNLT
ncbi:MAG: Holliday junction branch migration DNA helicase RuvB [Candidatus Magasanikbacteria bacterium]